jgi:hypothetical protein
MPAAITCGCVGSSAGGADDSGAAKAAVLIASVIHNRVFFISGVQ